MFRNTLTAAALAMLVATPAFAGNDNHQGDQGNNGRYDRRHDDRDYDRDDRRHHDKRKYDRRRDDDRYRDYRYYDRDRYDSRYSGSRYYGKDWRPYYPPYRNTHNRWRHSPPARYSVSFGYRSGYEQAWLDWGRYGRHDRGWHRGWYSSEFGYRAGYDEGWRDAARYYRDDYGPGYWSRDTRGSWFFGFRIDG